MIEDLKEFFSQIQVSPAHRLIPKGQEFQQRSRVSFPGVFPGVAFGFPCSHLAEKGAQRAAKSLRAPTGIRQDGNWCRRTNCCLCTEITAACPALGLLWDVTSSVPLNALCSASLPAVHIHLSLSKMEIWCLCSRAGTAGAGNCGMMEKPLLICC